MVPSLLTRGPARALRGLRSSWSTEHGRRHALLELHAWLLRGLLLLGGYALWRALRGASPPPRVRQLHPELLERARRGGVEDDGLYVTLRRDGSPEVLSLRCTHLGCRTRPEPGGGFACPCHGSRFGPRGEPERGPATEPLRALPVSRVGGAWMVELDDAGG